MAHKFHHSSHIHNVHHSKHLGQESYAGYDERRRQENVDFHMISEDHGAIANLPQDVKYHAYPRSHEYMDENLDDTMHGIDAQIDYDESQGRKHMKPKKI